MDKKDISLLPEEMRKAEEDESKKKKLESADITMHIPKKGKKQQNTWVKPLEKKEKVSIWKKLKKRVFGSPEERKKKKEKKKLEEIKKINKQKQREEEKKKRFEVERRKRIEKQTRAEEEKRREQEKKQKEIKLREEEERKKREAKEKQQQGLREEEKKRRLEVEASQRLAGLWPKKKKREENERKKKTKEKELPIKKDKIEPVKPAEHQAKEVEAGMRVSLIPEEFINPPEERYSHGLLIFIFSVLSTILIIGSVYLWMVWQESKVTAETVNIDDQIIMLDKKIKDYSEIKQNAQELQNKIGSVENLLNKHIYWTKFFDLLEQNTTQGIYYVSIAADTEGGVILSAIAEDYTAIARQLVAFNEAIDFINQAKVSSAVAQTGEEGQIAGVSFNIDLQLTNNVFIK